MVNFWNHCCKWFLCRFPIPDLRPTMDRRPWWKQALRKERLTFEFSAVEFNTSHSGSEQPCNYNFSFKELQGVPKLCVFYYFCVILDSRSSSWPVNFWMMWRPFSINCAYKGLLSWWGIWFLSSCCGLMGELLCWTKIRTNLETENLNAPTLKFDNNCFYAKGSRIQHIFCGNVDKEIFWKIFRSFSGRH